jgi:hypothetical protein
MQRSEPILSSGADTLFRRMAIWFMAFILAATYGWLAGFVRQPNGGLIFHWRWLVLIWACIGFVSTVYFWHKIWPSENRPATRKGAIEGTIALAVPGLWWLIFPLRSQSGQHLWEVIAGLTAAVVVLSFGAFLIFRLGRAFEDDKDAE